VRHCLPNTIAQEALNCRAAKTALQAARRPSALSRPAIEGFFPRILTVLGAITVVSCSSTPRGPAIDPDVARAGIARHLPAKLDNRDAWASDIFTAFEALGIPPTDQNACAVIAVAQQESTLRANPSVPGLPGIARKEIETRASSHHIPLMLVNAALSLSSPNGKTYSARLDAAKTEKDLSDIYEDFIGMVPMGKRLFGELNPVKTAGPMQVGIAYAEQHAKDKRYPYPIQGSVRDEVFTRRGGLYFGTAHLLDYSAPYDDMLFRFADYNAGHYASRNAAFQNAVSIASGTQLALDGDLLVEGASEPSNTELAVRKLRGRMEMTDGEIRSDLELGTREGFEKTKVYSRVFALADKKRGQALPRAMLPRIRLNSPKITRKLTTEWFARRVSERYRSCLSSPQSPGG
jgi:uncharacterized protein DUF1615